MYFHVHVFSKLYGTIFSSYFQETYFSTDDEGAAGVCQA